MGKRKAQQVTKYQPSVSDGSDDEIQLATLNIDAQDSDLEGSDLEDGPEMDFPEGDSEDEIPDIKVSDSETLNGKDSESLAHSKAEEEDSDEEYPSSDTELSEEEDDNSDIE